MKHCVYFLLLAGVLLLASCSRPDSQSLLQDAETACTGRDFDEAQAICDTIVMRIRAGETLEPEAACRLAMMLVRLGEENNLEDENTVSAWLSLRSVFEASHDSVVSFIRRLPPEEQGTIMMLVRLNMRQDTTIPFEFHEESYNPEHESCDSLDTRI